MDFKKTAIEFAVVYCLLIAAIFAFLATCAFVIFPVVDWVERLFQ